MGYSLELKRSSRQHQTSKIVKEKIQSLQANQNLKFQDKFKIENPIGDLHPAVGQNVNDGSLLQQKLSAGHPEHCTSAKATKDDELVKHMSNLPGYLQRIEKGEKHQENALNFGVLDWERLEKWKHTQKHVPERGSKDASPTTSNSSSVSSIGSSALSGRDQNESRIHHCKQQVSPCSMIKKHVPERGSKDASPTTSNSSSVSSIGSSALSGRDQNESRIHHSKQQVSPCSMINSSHRRGNSEGAKLVQGKVTCIKDFETSPTSNLGGWRKLHYTEKPCSRTYSETMNKKKDVHQKMSVMGTSSSNLRKHGVLFSSKKQMSSSEVEIEKRVQASKVSDTDPSQRHCSGKHKNIVLILPTNIPQNSPSGTFQLSEGRKLFDEKSTGRFSQRFPGDFSPEKIISMKLPSEIPHSLPLPCREESYTKSDMKPQTTNATQKMELPSNAGDSSPCSREKMTVQSEGKLETKHLNSAVIEMCKKQDHETSRGRNPSPSRRFNFGLGKLSRSSSFKEGSTLPQLSSSYVTVRSGPAKSESSACSVNSSRDKLNATSRARSSPLRRLLDPLLKTRGANLFQSAETVQELEGSFCSLGDVCDSLHGEKHEALTIQALLQVTMKNGLPLFKFVINNKSEILAATVKEATVSGKGDSSWIYTLYSVHEIKKKSGSWISQGSKGNNSSYAYDVVGRMKVSNSLFEEAEHLKNQYPVKECVLVGVDIKQGKEEIPEFVPNRELAAIVIRIPVENNEGVGLKSKDSTGPGSTTVILPSGMHGLPSTGAPSPLIDRWKSHGQCDCGGWDVGCKLQIFTSQDHYWPSRLPHHCDATNRFDLFVQGGSQDKKPVLSMAPFKQGIYSVHFNPIISPIQAFSTCAAVTSQQKSPVPAEANISDVGSLVENSPGAFDGVKGDSCSKFVPNPPLSPVGRV